jgi:hypothetical protein
MHAARCDGQRHECGGATPLVNMRSYVSDHAGDGAAILAVMSEDVPAGKRNDRDYNRNNGPHAPTLTLGAAHEPLRFLFPGELSKAECAPVAFDRGARRVSLRQERQARCAMRAQRRPVRIVVRSWRHSVGSVEPGDPLSRGNAVKTMRAGRQCLHHYHSLTCHVTVKARYLTGECRARPGRRYAIKPESTLRMRWLNDA